MTQVFVFVEKDEDVTPKSLRGIRPKTEKTSADVRFSSNGLPSGILLKREKRKSILLFYISRATAENKTKGQNVHLKSDVFF